VPGPSASTIASSTRLPSSRDRAPGEASLLWVVWLTYGSFYFCRVNIGATLKSLEGDLHIDKGDIGLILGGLKLAYGIGQLLNGQLAERIPPRRMLAIGMFGSALLNVCFGFGTAFYFLLFVWACNGYAQSLGWTPCVRVLANWVPPIRRGRAMGFIATGFQLMGVFSLALAGFAVENLGWQWAFFLPAVLLAGGGVFMLVFLRESPEGPPNSPQRRRGAEKTLDGIQKSEVRSQKSEVPDPEGRNPEPRTPNPEPATQPTQPTQQVTTHNSPAARVPAPFIDTLRDTLSNPALWVLALALFLLDACRYGFIDWGVTHLIEVQGDRVQVGSIKMGILPLGGIAGALWSGWATDRFFGGRRAPVICLLLGLLGVFTLAYDAVARVSLTGTLVMLAIIGFCIFGAQILLVGTAPADLARRGTAAAAAGFVNFMGYMGAFGGDIVTGTVVKYHGWESAIYIWAGWAFGAAVLSALLWNARSVKDEG